MAENKIKKWPYPQSVFMSYIDLLEKRAGLFSTRKDPEDLHQIRTSCRRLRNAMWVYRNSFSKSKVKKWNSVLKNLSKSAGQARDLDVHIIFLNSFKPANAQLKDLTFSLLNDLKKQRASLQPSIKKNLNALSKGKVVAEITSAVSNIRLEKNDLFDLARKKIFKRLKSFLKLKKFMKEKTNSKQLHKIRIAAKHLRYTLEGFEPLFGENLKPYTAAVLIFQDTLGRVHDQDVWILELHSEKNHNKSPAGPYVQFKQHCQELRNQAYDEFFKAWESAQEKKTFKNLKKLIKSHT